MINAVETTKQKQFQNSIEDQSKTNSKINWKLRLKTTENSIRNVEINIQLAEKTYLNASKKSLHLKWYRKLLNESIFQTCRWNIFWNIRDQNFGFFDRFFYRREAVAQVPAKKIPFFRVQAASRDRLCFRWTKRIFRFVFEIRVTSFFSFWRLNEGGIDRFFISQLL